jgi:hypothetical protein
MTNSKIYKVERTPDTSFFHRGDMNLTEVMSKVNGNDEVLKALAQYPSDQPRIEKKKVFI